MPRAALALLLALAMSHQATPAAAAAAEEEAVEEEGGGLLQQIPAIPRFDGRSADLLPSPVTWREFRATEPAEPAKEERGGRRRGFFRSPAGATILVVAGAILVGSLALSSSIDD